MMRLTQILPAPALVPALALAIGLALSAPVPATAQPFPTQSLDFPDEGAFCGLLTLCKVPVETTGTAGANAFALIDTNDANDTAAAPKSSVLLEQPKP